MSTREERILDVLRTRMLLMAGVARVEIEPPDDYEDTGPLPAVAIVPADVTPKLDQERTQRIVTLPVTIRVIGDGTSPTPGVGDVPASERSAGYALLAAAMPALFIQPAPAFGAYNDRVDGHAMSLTYVGHAVVPREDGGRNTAVYIDCEITYPLNLNNPAD